MEILATIISVVFIVAAFWVGNTVSEVKEQNKKLRTMVELLAEELGVSLYWSIEEATFGRWHGGGLNEALDEVDNDIERLDDDDDTIAIRLASLGKQMGLTYQVQHTEVEHKEGWFAEPTPARKRVTAQKGKK